MQIALTLLISAMQLLTMIQSNPNVSEEFKTYANQVANQAITVAQAEIAKASAPVVDTVTPSNGGAPVVSEDVTPRPIEILTNNVEGSIFGGNCEIKDIIVQGVKYSDGSIKNEIVMATFANNSTATGTRFSIKTSAIAGTNTTKLSVGSVVKQVSLLVYPRNIDSKYIDSNNWAEQAGTFYNPLTKQCY